MQKECRICKRMGDYVEFRDCCMECNIQIWKAIGCEGQREAQRKHDRLKIATQIVAAMYAHPSEIWGEWVKTPEKRVEIAFEEADVLIAQNEKAFTL